MKLQTGLTNNKLDKIAYFKDRLDPEVILETLGIETTGRSGPNIQAHCPDPHGMHGSGDSNPSWGFHVDKLVYNCFVCGGGTIVDLVQHVKECDEETAIDWLRVNSDLEPSTVEQFKDKIAKLLMPEQTESESLPSYSPDNLFKYRSYHPYLARRGITPEIANKMQVGFDQGHMAIVVPHMFRGKLVGMQRRHLLYDGERYVCPRCGEDSPKYKNTELFPKKTTLYNYDNIDFSQPVIVVESPFTALYLMSNGIDNVVATFGNFGPQQMVLLIGAEEVWVWPDNDNAGLKNLYDALLILERNVRTYIVPAVPGEKSDGADVAPENLQAYLDHRYPSMLFGMKGLQILGEEDEEV